MRELACSATPTDRYTLVQVLNVDNAVLCPPPHVLLLQPENFAKKGLMLPRPVRAWPPRENGKFDCIGQLPPVKQQLTAQAAA